jgi:ABC-type multidrug transport system ATPase subunit
MTITLHNAGKRYNRDWIFRHMDYTFDQGQQYALLGPNGSGKSTLLKAIAGYLRLSEGSLQVELGPQQLAAEEMYSHVSMCAPYVDLIEELTVEEHLHFHTQFQPLVEALTIDEAILMLGFQKDRSKLVKELSSGMRQRFKLMLTVGSAAEVLLLDEPATNLDADGVKWYHDLLHRFRGNRLVVIASNRADEYEMCRHYLQVEDYKWIKR